MPFAISPRRTPEPRPPQGDGFAQRHSHDHAVQFYDDPVHLATVVATHLAIGLDVGNPGIVIARPAHCILIEEKLRGIGIDLARPRQRKQLAVFDADETLRYFMRGELPDAGLFREIIGGALDQLLEGKGGLPVRAYGEMVDILWEQNKPDAALALEALWNDLADSYAFSLLCGYNSRNFSGAAGRSSADSIRSEHTVSAPAPSTNGSTESYVFDGLQSPPRFVSPLEQEEAKRKTTEHQLAETTARLAQREEELAAALSAAREADRMRHAFLGLMGHELKTPLNAINGFAELMLLGTQGEVTEGQRKSLQAIHRSQKQLLARVNQMLVYTRVMANDISYEFCDTPLHVTLLDVRSRIKDLEREGVTYEYVRCAGDVMVRADEAKLLEIVTRLVRNGMKYGTHGGRVGLEVELDADNAHIVVTDKGVGIEQETLDSLFDLPTQIRRLELHKRQGIGLGLAISRGYARGMGGDLTVTSTVGEGSVFRLTIPRAGVP